MENSLKKNILLLSASHIFVLGIYIIGNVILRHETTYLIASYFLCFVTYIIMMSFAHTHQWLLLGIGILLRLSLFLTIPSLSDDFYRFIWDGKLLSAGINPFENLPGEVVNQQIPGITEELFRRLNSPDYYTIYPPINQLIFFLATNFDWGILGMVNVLRFFILGSEIGVFLLIRKLLPEKKHLAFVYFLNPLVILELTGNIHFEGMMLFFILLFYLFFKQNNTLKSAAALAMAIGTKLLPLMYLPSLLIYMKPKKAILSYCLVGLLVLLMFIPLISIEFINGLMNSLGLYFQKFEFNASIYFIARAIGIWITGYNAIHEVGPIMAMLTLLSIIFIIYQGKKRDWDVAVVIFHIHWIYLMFATTIHPWYIVTLIGLSIFTNKRFPVVWSAMIFLTYIGYTETGFELHPVFIWLEYLVVGAYLIVEYKGTNLKLRYFQNFQ